MPALNMLRRLEEVDCGSPGLLADLCPIGHPTIRRRRCCQTDESHRMSESPYGSRRPTTSELIDAAAAFIISPDRGPALDRLVSLVQAADPCLLREELTSDSSLRWPEDWRILDSCRKQIDQQLSGNEFWPFGTAKIR